MRFARLALFAGAAAVSASPASVQAAGSLESIPPVVTPAPNAHKPTQTYKNRRDILDDVQSGIAGILTELGSALPSFVASGILPAFQAFPTGADVSDALGIDDEQLAALPTQVLQLPPYGNWTDQGWYVRFHGNVYKQPNTSEEALNELAEIFLIDVDIEDLPPDQQAMARNVTAAIFVVQQDDEEVRLRLEPSPGQGSSGEPGGGGAVTPDGGSQDLTLPYRTTEQGDYDVFLPIAGNGLMPGSQASQVQRLNVYANGTANLGNATAYLVPPTGLTILSDIDDILRITKIYDPAEGILNSFARPYVPWEDMPGIFANWSRTIPGAHFHYLTTTPEQVTRNYMDYIFKTYPGGSFDTRPLNFSDISATLSIRKFLLDKIFQTFPERKFILIADTSNSDVMSAYPQLVTDFPDQVQCIFLRNTSATDPDNRFPYNTAGFENLDQRMYMFFVHSDDLTNLDIVNGQCYNQSVPQNLTFGYQGLPFGLSTGDGRPGNATGGEGGAGMGYRPHGTFVALLLLAYGVWQWS